MVQDLRFAVRMLRKNPWFCAAIVATLALGMGANTTVFSLVNAVLLKPLPYPGGDRLVLAWVANPATGRNTVPVSYADLRDMRASNGSFERLEGISGRAFTLGESGNPPEQYRGALVTHGIFEMIGVQPVAGRGFEAADEKPGAAQAVVIGHGIWKDRYGRDPKVIGRTVRLNEKPATIVGVMPDGFAFPSNERLWAALVPDAGAEDRKRRDFNMIGMLKPGKTPGEARADLAVIAGRLEAQFPDSHKDNNGATVLTFHQAMNGGPIRTIFLLMLGAVGFVLLIACANVANMLLSRAMERTREVSIRTALGASRWRIARQLLMESVVLSGIGGLAGLGLAALGIGAFARAVENVGKPYWVDFSMDYMVFGYFAALTLVCAVIFGTAPALSASRVNLNETLKEGSRSVASSHGGYLSGALVVVQFTLAVVLLSGAGLMVRSLLRAQEEYAGIRGEQILKTAVSLPESRYPTITDRQQFFDRLMPRLSGTAGVRAVSFASNTPGGGGADVRLELEGRPSEASNRPAASAVVAGPGYLRLLGVNPVRGRDFEDTDGMPGKEAVIVGQNFAARYFPGEDPVGKHIRLFASNGTARPWMTIVGVTPEMRRTTPGERMTDPLILLPYRFEGSRSMILMLRTDGSPSSLTAAVRSEVHQLDPDLALFDTLTLGEQLARQRWYLRVFGAVFMIFAAIAMGMAAVGIYAVMARATIRRTREIGVRMALGADVMSILRLVLGRGLAQLSLGIVLGLGAALAVCRLMAGLLFGVSASDPLTFSVVVSALGAAGFAATWLPARRAARLDPVKALHYE